jgi:segregation and condensation protein B
MLMRQIEALLFVSPQPVSESELSETLGQSAQAISKGIINLKTVCDEERGITLMKLAGGWQMATAPDLESTVAEFQGKMISQRVRLSKAALETLAIVAYNQPVTRGEMEEIRTVRCDRVIDTLMKHGLVRAAGRKKSVGNPLLFRTTDRFLEIFGLESISSLPTLEELQDTIAQNSSGDNGWDEPDE